VIHKPYVSVHFAVQSCLARCQLAEAKLTSLSDFAEELEQAGWDQHSIEQVERGVLIGLYGVRAEVRERPLKDSQRA